MDGFYHDLAFYRGQEIGAEYAHRFGVEGVVSELLLDALKRGDEYSIDLLVGELSVVSDGFTDENGLSLSYSSSEEDDSDWQYEADENSFGTARWF